MSAPTVTQVANALAEGGETSAERLAPAIRIAEAHVRAHLPRRVVEEAVADLFRGLIMAGAPALAGGDPQRIEDALYAARPDSPLPEGVLRHAWLALAEDLARTGDRPPFGGSGGAEAWAMSARSRPWPFVDLDGQVGQVAALFGEPTRVVVVRGPGRSAFLAAVRRAILSAHGAEALVPPVLPAARDDLGPLLLPYARRAPMSEDIKQALPQLSLGEDLIGVLGRAGDQVPVALLLDDAHVQSRALLLGLPLYLEPSPQRRGLLVISAPTDAAHDGPLGELVADARDRERLLEITLPDLDTPTAEALLLAWFPVAPLEWAAQLGAQGAGFDAVARWRAAGDWLAALTDADGQPREDGAAQLEAGFDPDDWLPTHPGARHALAWAALEGKTFHALALAAALGKDEDFVEDLLHDDEATLDGEVVGGCERAVPSDRRLWADLPDGVHPVFVFADARLVAALPAALSDAERQSKARVMRDALLQAYGPAAAWQIADRLWHLDRLGGFDRQVQQMLIGTGEPRRVEAGFRRMLPVLAAETPFRLALARLFGSGMEAGGLGSATGNIQLADQGFQAAAAAAQRLGRSGAAGEALARLAELRVALALPEQALAAIDLAERLLSDGEHARSVARLALLRAEARVLEGDLESAVTGLTEGVEALRSLQDPGHAALGLVRLGRVRYELGDVQGAVADLDEAVRAADESRDPRPIAATRMARAFVHAEQDELEPSFALLQVAASAFQAAGMAPLIVEVAAAGLQRRSGNAKEAEERLRKAAAAFKQAGAAVQWADAWHEVGRCLLDQERFADAAAALRESLDVRQRARDRFGLVRLWENLADSALGVSDLAGALGHLARARHLCQRVGMAGRLGGLDARLAQLKGPLDGVPSVDVDEVMARAGAEVEELEAYWRAPPQPPNPEGPPVVH